MVTEENIRISQGHSISIYSEEILFIEKALSNKGINLDCLDRKQNILNLNQKYVGYIKTPKRLISFEPKNKLITLNHIMRLYYFVHSNYQNLNDNMFDLSNSLNYINIIEKFINELKAIKRRGLPTDYVQREEMSLYIQGSVDYVSSYKNIKSFIREPFHCEYDELTLNTPLNLTLNQAYKKISKQKGYRNALKSVDSLFKDINGEYKKKEIAFNSKNNYCKNAYFFAKLIIEESYFDDFGNSGGECLLIDGDALFENFIKKILFKTAKDPKFMDWKSNMVYGKHGGIEKSYKPDILYEFIEGSKTATAIIDVKNKFSTIFKNADVFQMFFYSIMLNSKKLILCYPFTEKKGFEILDIYSDGFKTDKAYGIFINIASHSKEQFKKDIYDFIEELYVILDKH